MMGVHLLAAFVPNPLIAATAMNLQHQAVVWCANKEGVELQFFVINDIDLWYEFPILSLEMYNLYVMVYEILIYVLYKL